MFKRIRKAITKITNILGGMTGMYKTLDKITDHPDIKITEEELIRIQRNKEFFKNEPEPIRFTDSNGDIQYRDQNTVNLSKIISKKLAKLVFNEGVTINVDDDATQEIVNELLYDNRFRQVFGEELEGGYAISGLAIVPTYDELTETVKFVYCSADNFIPLDGNTNVVTEAAIINKYRQVESEALVFYTLFAIHKKTKTGYKIEHELYKSSDHNIVGQQVSLSTIEETAELSDVVTLEGLKNPLFVYIKLAGKNNVNYGSPLGLGVVDNAYRLLCNFNEKYDQYMNEVSTATRQLVASASFFEVKYDPITKRPLKIFDPKTQVWQKLDTDGGLEQRQDGKTATLALGYGGGRGALIAMGALRDGIPENKLQTLVDKWRKANPNIVFLWRNCEKAAKAVIKLGGKKSATLADGKLKFTYKKDGRLFQIWLPSGRALSYYDAHVDRKGKIKYLGGLKADGSVWYKDTFGGKLVENIVQATARDILCHALEQVYEGGYDTLFHVHDEIIAEVPEGFNIDELSELMTNPAPTWAEGLPLGSEGDTIKYYRKV